jgi:hypothetical protein
MRLGPGQLSKEGSAPPLSSVLMVSFHHHPSAEKVTPSSQPAAAELSVHKNM